MQPNRYALAFKVLLNHYHGSVKESFLKGFPKEEAKEIFEQDITSQDVAPLLNWPMQLLSSIHYSWLYPLIKELPLAMQPYYVAALPSHQLQGLRKLFKRDFSPLQLSSPMQRFLLNDLIKRWQISNAIPFPYVEKGPLSPLLDLSKGDLVELIDLLAMNDLAEALRKIVDKKNLKAIYNCLSPSCQQFLRLALAKKPKVAAPKLDLSQWHGEPAELHHILHRLGLLRFGKALCGQEESMLWHLCHKLDTGRGEAIRQYSQGTVSADINAALCQQLLSALDFIKQKRMM